MKRPTKTASHTHTHTQRHNECNTWRFKEPHYAYATLPLRQSGNFGVRHNKNKQTNKEPKKKKAFHCWPLALTVLSLTHSATQTQLGPLSLPLFHSVVPLSCTHTLYFVRSLLAVWKNTRVCVFFRGFSCAASQLRSPSPSPQTKTFSLE